MLNEQTRHRIRLARSATALAGYELTNDDPGVSTRDIYRAVSSAEDALEDALRDIRAARRAFEGFADSGTNDEEANYAAMKLKVAAREARAKVEGDNARCAKCDAYFNHDDGTTCPLCGSIFHWFI